jgi:hypothetical protein
MREEGTLHGTGFGGRVTSNLVGQAEIENRVRRRDEPGGEALRVEGLRDRRLNGEDRGTGNDETGKGGNEQFFVVPGHLKSPKGLTSMMHF